MANFSKSFNFRGGFQVDTDTLVVRGQNVGIASTLPTEALDVNGIIKADGLTITSQQPVGIETANVGFLSATLIHSGVTSISNGIITATSTAGVVTYYGDGGRLLNLPTSQWVDIDVGLGFTSIYAAGYVGVDTTDPRYVFQVGGVPFAPKAGFQTSQTGVGIEDGAIFASGIITSGSYVSAATTVFAGQEFVGVGSNITILNADNIAIGSIGSMRYGDTIVTKEVYADRFIGTVTSAEDLIPEAEIDIVSVRAENITAVGRFISTEGNIVIGHNDPASNIGEVDVRKEDGDATIYSLVSTSANARIFVGNERQFGTNNNYGGLRFGGNIPNSPSSGLRDMDVVNYSPGNLNFYLHDGATEGGTTGAWRWVYGQLESIAMELSPQGKLSLQNLSPADFSLQVTGLSTFSDDMTVGGGLDVSGDSTFDGAVAIGGELSINQVSFASTVTIAEAVFTDKIIVGLDPGTGAGVRIDSNGNITATGNVQSGTNSLTPSGLTIASGTISSPDATIDTLESTTINSNSIDSDTYSSSGGFDVDNAGNVQANSVTADVVSISGALNIASVNIASGTFSNATITDLVATNMNVSGSSIVDELVVNGTLTANDGINANTIDVSDITIGSISGTTIGVSADLALSNSNNLSAGSLNIDATSQTEDLDVRNNADVGGDLSVTGDVNVNGSLLGQVLRFFSLENGNGYKFNFNVNEVEEELTIAIDNPSGSNIGEVTLRYN